MFITRKKLDFLLSQRDLDIQRLQDLYFELDYKHRKLMAHLGLKEVKIPETTEIRKIT